MIVFFKQFVCDSSLTYYTRTGLTCHCFRCSNHTTSQLGTTLLRQILYTGSFDYELLKYPTFTLISRLWKTSGRKGPRVTPYNTARLQATHASTERLPMKGPFQTTCHRLPGLQTSLHAHSCLVTCGNLVAASG